MGENICPNRDHKSECKSSLTQVSFVSTASLIFKGLKCQSKHSSCTVFSFINRAAFHYSISLLSKNICSTNYRF